MMIIDPRLARCNRFNRDQWAAYLRLRDAAALRARTERSRALRRLGKRVWRTLSRLIQRRRGSGPLVAAPAASMR